MLIVQLDDVYDISSIAYCDRDPDGDVQPKLLDLFLVHNVPGMTPQLPDLTGNTNPNP